MSHVSSATVADPRLLKAGFAMLQGDDVDFIMRTYDITLGRATAGPPTSKTADVGLGSNLNISRQHARIHYNFDRGCFELIVLGKNGATVSGEPYVPGTPPVALASGTLITICDVSFWFLLPRRSALPSLPTAAPSRPAQAAENGSRPVLPPQPGRPTHPASAPQPAAVPAPAIAQTVAQAGSAASAGIPPPTHQLNPQGAAQQQLMWQQQQQQQLLQQQQQRQQVALAASVSGGGSGGSAAAAVVPATMSQGVASEVTQAQVQAYQAYYAQLAAAQQRQQLLQHLAAQQQQQQATQQQQQQPQ